MCARLLYPYQSTSQSANQPARQPALGAYEFVISQATLHCCCRCCAAVCPKCRLLHSIRIIIATICTHSSCYRWRCHQRRTGSASLPRNCGTHRRRQLLPSAGRIGFLCYSFACAKLYALSCCCCYCAIYAVQARRSDSATKSSRSRCRGSNRRQSFRML